MNADPTYREAHVARHSLLTPREREVLLLIGQGLINKEIGSKLFISTRTVESHRVKIREKLNLTNEFSLTAFAVRYIIKHVEKQ